MHRADQHTQQQITDLVNACAGYWELRGITRERINEMQLELEQGTPLLELAHDRLVTRPGCFAVLPGLLADLTPGASLLSCNQRADGALRDHVRRQCGDVRCDDVRRQCGSV